MINLAAATNALSNPKRLQILYWLKEPARCFGPAYPVKEEEGVCGLYIAEKLGVSPPTASKHLKILTQAGFLRPQRVGKFTYFKRVEANFAELARAIEAI